MNNDKVNLRAIEPEDLDWLYKIENDEQLWNIGLTNVPYSRNILLDYITQNRADIYADKQLRLVIEDINDKTPVGIIDLVNFSPRHLRAEVGIVIVKKFRNKGFATSALLKIFDYCRNVIHLKQLYVVIGMNNLVSIKLFENVGFVDAGLLKSWLSDGEKWENARVYQFFL